MAYPLVGLALLTQLVPILVPIADIRSLAVPFHEFDLGYLNPVYVASGNDTMPIWLVHMASALHTLLVPQVE